MIGLVRMIFPMQLAGVMMTVAPMLPVVLPVVGAVFLLTGGVLTFKASGRE